MDYVLVAFLVAEKTALSYAVGEWARIWPLQSLVRAMGAFFVRRNSANPLYRQVLQRYVHNAARAGVCQAIFLEGGLSKDGALRRPRFGFIDYMLRDYHLETDRDIVFVPIGINYDRVIEDRTLLRKLNPQAAKVGVWQIVMTLFHFIFKHTILSRRERWKRFGYASVNFGKPVSMRQYCADRSLEFSKLDQQQRFTQVEVLADHLMDEIRHVIPILPVTLMANIVLETRQSWRSELELKALAMERIDILRHAKAPISIASNACESVLSSAITLLIARGMLHQDNGLLRMNDSAEDILRYYANALADESIVD